MTKKDILVLSLCCVAFFSGCISMSAKTPVIDEYVFSPPGEALAEPAKTDAAITVTLRRFSVAKPFDRQFFVYRYADNRIKRDYYNRFGVSPDMLLTQRSADILRSTDYITYVSTGNDRVECPYEIRGHVTELSGDYRDAASPQACLAIRFSVFDIRSYPARLLFERDYACTVAIKNKEAAQLVRGWQTCVRSIIDDLSADLSSVLE